MIQNLKQKKQKNKREDFFIKIILINDNKKTLSINSYVIWKKYFHYFKLVVYSSSQKYLSPIVGALSIMLVKKFGLDLLNPVMSANKKYWISHQASAELIRAMTGERGILQFQSLTGTQGRKLWGTEKPGWCQWRQTSGFSQVTQYHRPVSYPMRQNHRFLVLR